MSIVGTSARPLSTNIESRRRRAPLAFAGLLAACLATSALAGKTEQYSYDARGRLTQITGNAGGNLRTSSFYSHGMANNRSNFSRNVIAPVQQAGDFNGDGYRDILWRNVDGTTTDWLGTAAGGFTDNWTNAVVVVGLEWQVAAVGDFNGDSRSDILWRRGDGTLMMFNGKTDGGFTAAWSGVLQPSWRIAGVGDFNADGRADLLLASGDSKLTLWLGTATGGLVDNSAISAAAAGSDWTVISCGDYNGDGRSDIFWRKTDGTIAYWVTNANGSYTAVYSGWVDASWHIIGSGDFNGDGRSDLLWRNDNGDLANWLSTAGNSFVANAYYNVGTDAWVAAIGDLNHDGRADVVWRTTGGGFSNWLGTTTGTFTDNAANGYSLVPTSWFIEPR